MTTNMAMKAQPKVTQVERPVTRTQTQAKVKTDIETNPVFKAVMSEDINTQEQISSFVKVMLENKSKAEQRAAIKNFVEVREWLSNVAKTMDVRAITDEDSEAMSRVTKVINEMGDHLRSVSQKIMPMLEKVDSFQAVTKGGDLYGVYEREAQNKEALAKIEADRQAVKAKVVQLKDKIDLAQQNIDAAKQETGWLSGKVKPRAQARIDESQASIDATKAELLQLATRVEELNKAKADIEASTPPEFKAFLEMIRMSPEDINAMQKAAQDESLAFIQTSDEQLAELSKDFDEMMERKNKIQDNTAKLVTVFGTLTEGLKTTIEKLKEQRKTLLVVPENESMPEKAIRENKVADLDEFITELTTSQVTTNQGYADLGIKSVNTRAAKEKFSKIMALAKSIQVDGVAKASSGLSMSLHAINQAVIENAAIGAQQILNSLGTMTDEIAQKDWMQISQQTLNIKKRLEETMARTEQYNTVYGDSILVARDNMSGIQQLMNELQGTVQESLNKGKEYGGLSAETEDSVAIPAKKDGTPKKNSLSEFAA